MSERSIYFAWLEMVVAHYNKEMQGDDTAQKFWDWCVNRFKPDGFEKEEDN
jgi:hypothetical protein